MSFYDTEDYARIKDSYVSHEKCGNWMRGDTAFFAQVNGKYITWYSGGCHAGLRFSAPVGADYIVSCVDFTNYKRIDGYVELAKKMTDLLINHSVFSHLFLTKDIDRVVEDGFFVMSTDNNRDLIVNACIHSRLVWEYPYAADKVVKLWEAGVHPMLALYIGQVVRELNGVVTFAGPTGSHNGVCMNWPTGRLKGFILGEYKESPTFRKSNNYNEVVAGFGKGTGTSAKTLINRMLLTTKVKGNYQHPFPKYSKLLGGLDGIAAKDFYKTVYEKQDKLIAEICA